MLKDYKINSRNSTVCGYPGREFDWAKFCWNEEGENSFHRPHYKCPKVWTDNGLIEPNCEYLHVPYTWSETSQIFRVRPNDSMLAGKVYRGHLIIKQTAIKKEDGWYWRLEMEDE